MLASQKADALAAMSAAQLSSDIADTIEGLMPSLKDIFCGSEEGRALPRATARLSSKLLIRQIKAIVEAGARYCAGVFGQCQGRRRSLRAAGSRSRSTISAWIMRHRQGFALPGDDRRQR
jgi:hypothetical protein